MNPSDDRLSPETFLADLAQLTEYPSAEQAFDMAAGSFAQRRDWTGLRQFAAELKRLALPDHLIDLVPTSTFDGFIDSLGPWVESIVKATADSSNTKAIAISIDSSAEFVVSAFLCFSDESDAEDWPAFFDTYADGPHLKMLIAPWFTADDSGIGFRATILQVIAEIGSAIGSRGGLGAPAAWVNSNTYNICFLS